jgi:predicted nucleic acid-binding protein
VLLNELPEPYLILMDRKPLVKLSKVVNIIARKTDYRISFFSATDFFGYVIMEKKKEEGQ